MKKSFEMENEDAKMEQDIADAAAVVCRDLVPSGKAQVAALDRSDALAVAAESAGMEGDFQMSDFKIPYFQIVQPTSESEYGQGSFTFNKDFLLSDGGKEPVEFTVLGLKKELVEDLPYESELTPRRWPSEEAAKKDGFFNVYGCDNYAKPEAQMTLLIKCDDDIATHFFEGQGYVRALWSAKGSSYTAGAKPIITAVLSGHLRGCIYKGPWTVTTLKKVMNKKTYFVPVLKSGGLHSEEFVEWINTDVLMK